MGDWSSDVCSSDLTPQGLSYRGRVGSGIVGRTALQLLEELESLRAETSPFCDEVPRVDALGTVWVRPAVVVEIARSEERRVGDEGGSRCRSQRAADPYKKNDTSYT